MWMVLEEQEGRQERRGDAVHEESGRLLQSQARLDQRHPDVLAETETSWAVMSNCTGCEVHKAALHGRKHHSCGRGVALYHFMMRCPPPAPPACGP